MKRSLIFYTFKSWEDEFYRFADGHSLPELYRNFDHILWEFKIDRKGFRGYGHKKAWRRATEQEKKEFLEDITKIKITIEDIQAL